MGTSIQKSFTYQKISHAFNPSWMHEKIYKN